MATTQAQLDQAYAEGKAAWMKEVRAHLGPTLHTVASERPTCKYKKGSKLEQAFWRGYYQDVRRVVPDGTVTGRFSSSTPNIENIPIRTEEGRKIREAFTGKPGEQK